MSEKKVKKLRRDVAQKMGRVLHKRAMRRLRRIYLATDRRGRRDFDVQPVVAMFVREDVARAMRIIDRNARLQALEAVR